MAHVRMFLCMSASGCEHALLATDNPTAQLSQSCFHSQSQQCERSQRALTCVRMCVWRSVCVCVSICLSLPLSARLSVSLLLRSSDSSPVSEAVI